MNHSEFQQFKAVIGSMGRLYGADVDQPLLDAYWLALRDWSLPEFQGAAAHLMGTSKFMPKPAEFNELRKAGQPTAAEAFAKARQIARSLYQRDMASHNSGDAKLDAAIRACGGYETLAMCTTENIGFFERRFAEHFESITDAEAVRQAVPQIAGAPRLAGPSKASFSGLLPWRAQ